MSFSQQQLKRLVLLLILLCGILITSPYFNYQDYVAQGDHGRDLYAAQAVYRGELPYKDFWWVYGPLTPYYYGLFFKVFGTAITSMILGKLVLIIAGGLLLTLAMMEITSLATAFLCGCWFMLFHEDFFFTYNHLAGVVMDIGIVYCLLSYIKNARPKVAFCALAFVFVLCLIKINFGLAALVVSLITITVCDRIGDRPLDTPRKSFYALALLGIPLLLFLIYWSLLHGLSSMEIRQCLPYKEGDQPYETSVWTAVSIFMHNTWVIMRSTWMNSLFALLINASLIRCIYLLAQNRLSNEYKRIFLLSLGLLALFYMANSHEYLKSGVWYRQFWAQPMGMMMSFLIIDCAIKNLPPYVRKIIYCLITFFIVYGWVLVLNATTAAKDDTHYLNLPRGGVYLTNAPEWISTVEATTDYLNKNLKSNELFLALPYDCLYYYLTDKRTPTRQLIFFEHIKIPPEQERSIIAELEKNHVNYVLLSSRAFARKELGLGWLGKTYCPIIGKYIQDNFAPIARFGNWTDEPGWAWNHGTLVLKRNHEI